MKTYISVYKIRVLNPPRHHDSQQRSQPLCETFAHCDTSCTFLVPGRVHTEEGSELSQCPVVPLDFRSSWQLICRSLCESHAEKPSKTHGHSQAAAIRWSKCCTSPRWVCHPTSTTLWGDLKGPLKRRMTATTQPNDS